MEELASQAAEVQAASKALDLREQQLSVSANPVAPLASVASVTPFSYVPPHVLLSMSLSACL
jgi:hypothetical protein